MLRAFPRALPFFRQRTAPLHCSALRLGITDSLLDTFQSKMNTSKENNFKKMIDDMSASSSWDLKKWKATIEEQVNSWTMYVPGVGSSEQASQLKEILKILDAMHSEELAKPLSIKGPQKERIAVSSGVTVERVTHALLMYKQSLVVHEWLKLKKANGEVLPQSEAEMANLQKNDTRLRSITSKIMMPRGHKKKGRGKFNL